jgi:hypothetical protein
VHGPNFRSKAARRGDGVDDLEIGFVPRHGREEDF